MKLHDLAVEIREAYLKDRRIAFYVAAGISNDCPSHLPPGRELRQAVISGFLEVEEERGLLPVT